MLSKNIVFTKPGCAELLEEEVKALGPKDILVELEMSSVSSGTEKANLLGVDRISPAAKEVSKTYPRRLGYSCCGKVIEVGTEVTKHKVGDRVALAWSTHSQYNVITEDNAYPIDDIDPQDAALFNICTFPMAAVRKCRTEMGESAIVMGMGVLGLISVKLLRIAGATPIIAVDPVEAKREQAIKYGADYAFDPYDPEFSKKVKEVTKGGCNVGIEVTGIGAGLDGILDCMQRYGRVALLGCTRNSDFSIDYYGKVHGPGITLIGAHTMARPKHESHGGWWTQADDFYAIKKLTQTGRLELKSLVEEVHCPCEATEVYNRLAREKFFPVVQFDWRKVK